MLVQSAPEQGTQISFWLHTCRDQAAEITAPQESKSTLNGLTILVVEDDKFVRNALSAILNHCDCNSVAVDNGREALELFKRDAMRFDLAIIDLAMPEMDGEQVVQQMLELRSEFAIVLTTGNPMDSRIDNCFQLGIRECLRKPYSFADIREVLTRVVDGTNGTESFGQ